MQNTKLFVILNEETLETVKGENGNVKTFGTSNDADDFASEELEMWQIVPVDFLHGWIKHLINS